MQFVINRLSESNGTTLYDTSDNATYCIALLLDLHDELSHLCCHCFVGTANGILLSHVEVVVEICARQDNVSHLLCVSLDVDAEPSKGKLRESTCHHATYRFASRTSSTATMVANAIFLFISIIGMRGTEYIAHILVVLAVLICVANEEADGCTCRLALEDAAQQLHFILLLASRCESALPRFTSSQFALNEVHIDFNASRHAVNDATYRSAMTLAKRSKTEKGTK